MKTTASGRKIIWLLSALILLLVLLVSENLFLRLDMTESKRFSVSAYSREFLRDLQEPVRITYFVSPELSNLYPQTRNIGDFLAAYASETPFVSVASMNPVKEEMESSLIEQGIYGRQIQSSKGNSIEYITVYSAILIEYLDMTATIPFILSDETLEYELTSRLMQLVEGHTRPVYVMVGNGMSLSDDYSYVVPWLESAGFSCSEITPQEFVLLQTQSGYSAHEPVPLVVIGTSSISLEQAQAVRAFVESGGNAVIFSSTITADIYGDWSASPVSANPFASVLDDWGLSLGSGILNDISCFRMTLYSDDDNPQYETLNYPMWISSLSQYCSDNPLVSNISGLHFFWANPIRFHGDGTEALALTSPAAWCLEPDMEHESHFISNPFLVAKTASQAGVAEEQFVLVATKSVPDGGGKVVLVGNQYFVSTMLLDYSGSSPNLDFLVNCLLSLSKNDSLLGIKNRSYTSTSLYKVDDSSLIASRPYVIALTCVFMPLLPGVIAGTVHLVRSSRKSRLERKERNSK